MTKKMLISINELNEIRVAFLENQRLYNLEIESEKNKQKKGNIYKAIITKIEPSLDAVFVNYGADKDGFLPFKEISKDYLSEFNLTGNIDLLSDDLSVKGRELIIQIEKEERDGKGAALTTYLSLAGCYLVLMPNNSELEGISRHIDGEERYDLKEKLTHLNIPKNFGVIIRTSGIGRSIDELKWEADILISQFKIIKNLSDRKKAPCLIYEDGSLVIKTIRDYLKPDIDEIIIDDINIFNLVYKYLTIIKSDFTDKVKLYYDVIPLFSKYKIEYQIELAFKREIFLPSGGSIVIDHAEALTSIDINSAKSNKCDDIEETALQTNLEAVDEITRQLKIRDLGGLIIIDFIDMDDLDSQKLIEKKVRDALLADKAKIQIGKISKFGLLEISRQRLKSSLVEYNQNTCYKCGGTGRINNIEVLSLMILKALEEESAKPNIYQIHLELPVKILTYIINMKKNLLLKIEKDNDLKIVLIANKYISIPDYKIYRFKVSNKKIKVFNKNDIKTSHIHDYFEYTNYNVMLNDFKFDNDDTFISNEKLDSTIENNNKENLSNKLNDKTLTIENKHNEMFKKNIIIEKNDIKKNLDTSLVQENVFYAKNVIKLLWDLSIKHFEFK